MNPTPEQPAAVVNVAAPATSDVPVWAIRLEAKVDVALTQHAARIDGHASELADHETRLREVEQRKTVSPTGLWTAVVGGISGAAALVGIASNVLPH